MRGPMHGQYPELEQYWNQSQSSMGPASMHNAADKWITEFGNQNNNPESWANSFEQQYGPNGWASEFEQVRVFSMLVQDFLHCLFRISASINSERCFFTGQVFLEIDSMWS